MFTNKNLPEFIGNCAVKDCFLSIEVRNVLALNDAAASVGEDRFFYFSDPRKPGPAPSLFITKEGYGPLIAFEKYKWSKEEQEVYWSYDDESERFCLLQFELSTIKLENKLMPLLLFTPTDEMGYVSWPNDTIARAFFGVIEDELYLSRRVDWEHVAVLCGRRCEIYFNKAMDPPTVSLAQTDYDPFEMSRISLRAMGPHLHQCFLDLTNEIGPRDWVKWSEVKGLLVEQEKMIEQEKVKAERIKDGENAEFSEDGESYMEGLPPQEGLAKARFEQTVGLSKVDEEDESSLSSDEKDCCAEVERGTSHETKAIEGVNAQGESSSEEIVFRGRKGNRNVIVKEVEVDHHLGGMGAPLEVKEEDGYKREEEEEAHTDG